MTIVYKGSGVRLTVTPQVIISVPETAKGKSVVNIVITNTDTVFKRTLGCWLNVESPTRNLALASELEIEFGHTSTMSGVALNPGETLTGYAETDRLLSVVATTGEVN